MLAAQSMIRFRNWDKFMMDTKSQNVNKNARKIITMITEISWKI